MHFAATYCDSQQLIAVPIRIFCTFLQIKLNNMNNQEDKMESEQKTSSDSVVPIQPRISDFVIRLKSLIADNSIADFSRQCGVPESTIRSYLVRGKTPGMEHLLDISSACGVTVDWLATGKGIKYIRDLKHAQERLNGAPPRAYGEFPEALKLYEKRLDALLHYLAMIEDELEVEQILSEVTLRAETVIKLNELQHTVNELRAEYLKKNKNHK